MKALLVLVFVSTLVLMSSHSTVNAAQPEPFRFSLFNEPHDIDPAKLSGNETSYFVANLFRGLYRYDDQKGLVPVGATSCKRSSPLTIVCTLNQKVKWSNGEVVVAADYVRAFQHILDPNTKAKEAGLLLNLKMAKEVLGGKSLPTSLGVIATNQKTLQFEFEKPDEEFMYKLSSPLFVPLKVIPSKKDPSTYIFNGPYKIKDWEVGKRVILEPNLHYPFGHKNRPSLEVLFIEEGTTAVDMFRLKKLDFVTEISFTDITYFKKKPEFVVSYLARFDYIGFGEELMTDKNLRTALALGVDYEEFKLVFDQNARTGCTGLPDSFMDKIPCYNFDLKKAKEAFAKVDKKLLTTKPKLYFTKIASGNLQTVAEWYQAQWKKHLGLEIDLQAMEYSMYRQQLRTTPPSMFRVGVALDRPTCLAALETFQSESKDNFLRLKNPTYDKFISELSMANSPAKQKTICRKAVEFLLNEYLLIPQGKVQYSRLLNPAYKGLHFNSMGHVDFSNLHKVH